MATHGQSERAQEWAPGLPELGGHLPACHAVGWDGSALDPWQRGDVRYGDVAEQWRDVI